MSEFTYPLHLFFRPKDSRGVYNNSNVQKNGKGLKSVQNIKQKSTKIRVTSNLLRTKIFFIMHKYRHIKFPLVCGYLLIQALAIQLSYLDKFTICTHFFYSRFANTCKTGTSLTLMIKKTAMRGYDVTYIGKFLVPGSGVVAWF